MRWTPFRFVRRRRPTRQPIRRARPVVEALEARLAPSATNVLTYHNDNQSTGQNLTETALTPANVNSSSFGKLFSTSVDGQVYAQPLYMAGVNITIGNNQGTHNVVFIATEHDSLYAIDSGNGTVLWHDALLQAVHGGTVTTVPNGDTNSGDISPEIGITSTPVIDASSNLIYVEAKTKEVASDGTHYIHQLYAISVNDGSYKLGSPVVIGDTISNDLSHYTYVSGPWVNGTGDGRVDNVTTFDGGHTNVDGKVVFNALRQMNRPGLTEANGDIYIAYASHGDNSPYHGWVLGFKASTLALNAVLNTTPNGGLGGIWQGGGRVAADTAGNLYFETGNGSFNNGTLPGTFPSDGNYGDSFVKLSIDTVHNSPTNQNINGWGLQVADFFTPFDQQNLNNGDLDLGSGGPALLPDSVGSTAHPHLMVGAGKEGRIYLIDRDNMGKFDVNTDHVVQETNNTTITGSFDTPAYYNGQIYYVGGSNIGNPNDVGKTFSISAGQLSTSPTSQGPDSYAYPGDTPSISANGATNGIVWAVDTGTSQLRAYNATGFNTELYTTAQAAGNRDAFVGSAVKFAAPSVADGEVYVGTSSALMVYGLIQAATQPPAAPSNLVATAVSGSQISLTWKDNSVLPNTANGFDIEQSTDGGQTFTQVATASAGTTTYTVGGLQTSTTYTFRMRAFNNIGNSAYSDNAGATTTSQAPVLDFSNGFANAASLLTFNGTAKINGVLLQLTDGGFSEAASAFSTSKVNVATFSTQFGFQLLNGTNPSADGFTFTIQGVGNTALGGLGGGLGYQGIGSSVAIKFDLYNNAGEGTNSTGLYTNGAAPTVPAIDLTGTGIDLHSQDKFTAFMLYDGTTLKVTITDTSTNAMASQSYTINIPGAVGGSTAYVGFTAGTGGLTATQDILTWTYTPGTTTPPAAPSNLTAKAASATEVDLAWTNQANNQTGFKIDRATDSGFTQNLLTQTTGASATTFIDGGLTPGATYYYRVRANNPAGDSANSNSVSITLPITPAAVSNLQVTRVTTNEVDLSWTNNATNATDIKVFRQKGNNSPILIADLTPTTTSLADTGLVTALVPGTHYTYNVQAVNAAGPSPVTSVTTITAQTPANLALAIDAGGGAAGPFVTDTDFSGGSALSVTNAIDTSLVNDPAPQAVYQTWRSGNFTYTVPNLTPGVAYVVRLDFSENLATAAGQRKFNVAINGGMVLSHFDVFAQAGGEFKALEEQFSAIANSSGNIVLTFTGVVGPARVNGIAVYAHTLRFSNFSRATSSLTLNGSAKLNGNRLELTDGNINEAGSAFTTNPVNVDSFITQFRFQLTNPNADGFTFVIQGGGPTALGALGGGLGYAGLGSSVAVKFDLFNNQGEGSDSTGLYTDGASPTVPAIDLTNTPINLHSGHVCFVGMTYDGTTLTVTEADTTTNKTAKQSYAVNIPSLVGGGIAYLGFTGGTSGMTAIQDILSWNYTPTTV
jgi:hypothetical protein